MPNPTETLPGIYLGAASLICLVSYFGARSRRLGFQRSDQAGDVTRLWLQWLTWNRSLAPEDAPVAAGAAEKDTVRATPMVEWQTATSATHRS